MSWITNVGIHADHAIIHSGGNSYSTGPMQFTIVHAWAMDNYTIVLRLLLLPACYHARR